MSETSSTYATNGPITVYVIVHELFGIYLKGNTISLLPPVVPPCKGRSGTPHQHKYSFTRFRNGNWSSPDQHMAQNGKYTISGLIPGARTIMPYVQFSPYPPGAFAQSGVAPYCTWSLPMPKRVHQLRIVNIPYTSRPLFTGNPHGDAVDAQLQAIALVQAFEYQKDPNKELEILQDSKPIKLDYRPDDSLPTVNLHLWAQLEDESDITDAMADMHAKDATLAVKSLFNGLNLEGGARSLSVDDQFSTQLPMPLGIRFLELMTLAEKFQMQQVKFVEDLLCSARTCGHGGSLYVAG